MLRLGLARRDAVPVDVENLARDRRESRETGLLAPFAQRRRQQVGVAIDVPTELQPAVKFVVMREQHPTATAVDDPRRRGEVSRDAGAQKTVGVRGDEGRVFRRHRRLVRVEGPGGIGTELRQERLEINRHGLDWRAGALMAPRGIVRRGRPVFAKLRPGKRLRPTSGDRGRMFSASETTSRRPARGSSFGGAEKFPPPSARRRICREWWHA